MESLTIQRRVERMIGECRALGIEPEPRTIAEIMVDDDVTRGTYVDFSEEWDIAFEMYEKAAERALARVKDASSSWAKRKKA
jgi:hypothetical protein